MAVAGWTPAMLDRLRRLDGATASGGGVTAALEALAAAFPDARRAAAALEDLERSRRLARIAAEHLRRRRRGGQ